MTSDATKHLQSIADLFASVPKQVRLQALLDYSRRLPDPPARLLEHPELMEEVPECQTPFSLYVEAENGAIRIYFKVPAESPTVRGYAGILHDSLDGASPEEILSVPDDFYRHMGLQEAVSGQRLRGMGAILARLKEKVEQLV
jgi:cysteine desulfuration protein SufE